MKTFSVVLILVFLINCKEEKTFADDIVLSFPKDTKMTIQEFNNDSLDFGSNVIYKGILKDSIQIKYYKDIDWIPAPPPPGLEQKNSDYLPEKSLSKFFYDKPFQGISSESIKHTDDLNLKNLQIVVKANDTIPLYKIRNDNVISFKSYPIFIKNIDSKSLKINIDYQSCPK